MKDFLGNSVFHFACQRRGEKKPPHLDNHLFKKREESRAAELTYQGWLLSGGQAAVSAEKQIIKGIVKRGLILVGHLRPAK